MSSKTANKGNNNNNNPSQQRRVRNNTQLAIIPKGGMPQLPSIPKKEKVTIIEKKVPKKKKSERKTKQRGWWDLTGDILYNLGSKALTYSLDKLTGWGDYEVQSNTLLAAATEGKNGSNVPIMANSKVGNILRHREFLGNVLSDQASFKPSRYPINPGLDTTFPFASNIAKCYSNYRMRGAMVEYISLTSDFSAVGTLGFVSIGTQYNSIEGAFTSNKELLNSEYSNSCKPSEDLCHPIECAPGQLTLSELYVRSGDPPANTDIRMCDLGCITVAVGSNNNTGAVLGELWITYELELYFPKLAIEWAGNFLSLYIPNGYTNAAPFLNAQQGLDSTMGTSELTSNKVILSSDAIGQKFRVLLEYIATGGATMAQMPTITAIDSTCSPVNIGPNVQGANTVLHMTLSWTMTLDKDKVGGFQFDATGGYPGNAGTNGSGFLSIIQLPSK